jgi:5'-methylthioadenosine phosphorylase
VQADIGIFGGSGFYEFLDAVEEFSPKTPFGPPSAPLAVGEIAGRRVAFLPRHGRRHEFAPAAVPARANLWTMRMLGVRQVIGPCAAGSLSADIHPGDFVVLDQLVDRTWGRPDTYYDRGDAHHVAFADPYCPVVAAHATAVAARMGVRVHPTGTVVVIPGPRFATRAESRWYRAQGWDVINMTQYPEAYLARELGMHYAGIALVTDYDTGVEDDPNNIAPVSQEQVFAFFEENVHRVRELLVQLVPDLPDSLSSAFSCSCAEAVGPLTSYEAEASEN